MTASAQWLWIVVAGVLAWLAIALVAGFGRGRLREGPLRVFGGLALAALGLRVAGVPVPEPLPLVLLAVGVLLGLWGKGR